MKFIINTLFVMALTSVAHAGHEGPQAAPPPRGPMAELRISSMFTPPFTSPSLIKYLIYASGEVTEQAYYRGTEEPKIRRIKYLTAIELGVLYRAIKQVVPGDLYDPKPTDQGCLDAPTRRYIAYSKGIEIEIGRIQACKTLLRKDASPADAQIIQLLDGALRGLEE